MPALNHKLALFVNHNIFLDENQRTALANGESIECTGVSSPVWLNSTSGATTEPAPEIFCCYQLKNVPEKSGQVRGIKNGTGYILYLPQKPAHYEDLKPLNYEEMASMSREERNLIFKLRDKWHEENPEPPHPGKLLESGYLKYEVRATAKLIDDEKKRIYVSHNIEIKPLEKLAESLVM